MDKNTKIALGITLAGVLYIHHWELKELRKKHNLLNSAVYQHLMAHRQANVDHEFNKIVKNFDRW